MKTKNSTYNRRINPALRFMGAFMLLFAFSFTACSGTLFKNLLKSLDRIEVSPGLVNIANGTTSQLTATAIFSDGTKKDISSEADWESSNSNVATVSSSGLVTARLKNQSVTVTAAYKDLQSTATVNVTDALLVSLQVTPGVKSIANGTTYNFYATGLFTDNTTQDLTTQATWTGGGTICSVGANTGIVTGLSEGGPETITASVTVGTVTRSDTADVSVTGATLQAITTSVTAVELIEGTEYHLRATGYYSDSTTQDITTQATWSSDDEGTCTVGASTGLLTAQNILLSSETATITATFNAKTATTVVTVTDATILSIAVTPEQTIAYGTNVQFKALATLSNGKQQDITATALWSSLHTDVATISNAAGSEGLATSVGAGETVIYATLSVTGEADLSVRIATLQSLSINVETAGIDRGDTYAFHVQGTFWDGSDSITYDITDQVSWSSSNTGVAEISNAPGTEGLATGIANGTVTITASRNSITDTATLTVTSDTKAPAVTKAELLPGNRVRVIYDDDVALLRATNYDNYKIADSTTLGGVCGTGYTFSGSTQTADFGFDTSTPIVVESMQSFILSLNAGTQQKTYRLLTNDSVEDDPSTTGITDIAGNDIVCPDNQYAFQGLDTVRPYMVNVINTGKYITVRYSEAMKTGSGDTNSADYTGTYILTLEPSGSSGRTIESVTAIDSQTYKLELNSEVTSGTQYRLTVNSNVRDTSANLDPLDSTPGNRIGTPRYLSFTGNETLKVISAEEISMDADTGICTVIITFNKAVLASSANADDSTCESLYKIYPDAGNLLTATTGTGSYTNTVTLTYQGVLGRTATSYTLIVANGLTGDNFDNASDTKIYADPYNASDCVQAEPKDRATFQGHGQTINSFDDGTFFEDPFVDGTSFAFAFAYGGKVYLGTNDMNNSAFRFDPGGTNSVLITFAATSYSCANADGFGYGTGTTCGLDMGFNGERGVVGFNSVTVTLGGTGYELLMVGPWKTGVTSGYFTQDLDTQLDWTPVTLGVTGGSNTESIQTLYAVDNHVYFGLASDHGTQSPLVSYHTASEISGVVSISSGADMGVRSITGLGKVGGNPADVVAIESIFSYNGKLFMANNGGIVYNSVYNVGFKTGFSTSTPSAFTGTTLQLPSGAAGLGKVSPGQKGIPILIEFNGTLYMVRNVGNTDPQQPLRGEVWKCTAVDGTCDPGDWTRIISGTETELGTASSISMLIANGSGVLYVGYDDPSGTGVRIFKYTGTEPGATSGTMSSAGWSQQGVTGLGGSYKRILSSASITDGLFNYVYVTVVNGSNAIRVFRQID